MGEITLMPLTVAAVLAVVAAAEIFTLAWNLTLYGRNRQLRAELQTELAIGNEWKARYQQLVEDVRKQANQPRNVPTPEAKPAIMRASSSAEIRREFDRINARVLEQDSK